METDHDRPAGCRPLERTRLLWIAGPSDALHRRSIEIDGQLIDIRPAGAIDIADEVAGCQIEHGTFAAANRAMGKLRWTGQRGDIDLDLIHPVPAPQGQ